MGVMCTFNVVVESSLEYEAWSRAKFPGFNSANYEYVFGFFSCLHFVIGAFFLYDARFKREGPDQDIGGGSARIWQVYLPV